MRPQWVDVVRLRGKWNICLHLQKTYEHQTRQGLDILWGAIPLNFAWHLISWSMLRHVTVWKIYIFTFTGLIASNLGRVLTSGSRSSLQTLKSPPTSCSFSLQQIWMDRQRLFLSFFLLLLLVHVSNIGLINNIWQAALSLARYVTWSFKHVVT